MWFLLLVSPPLRLLVASLFNAARRSHASHFWMTVIWKRKVVISNILSRKRRWQTEAKSRVDEILCSVMSSGNFPPTLLAQSFDYFQNTPIIVILQSKIFPLNVRAILRKWLLREIQVTTQVLSSTQCPCLMGNLRESDLKFAPNPHYFFLKKPYIRPAWPKVMVRRDNNGLLSGLDIQTELDL